MTALSLERVWVRCLIAAVLAAILAAAVTSSGDYGVGMRTGDSPAPAINALLSGNFAATAHSQPVIGLTSILLRAPFVALASLVHGGTMLAYRLGLFACAFVAGLVGLAVSRRGYARGRSWVPTVAIAGLMVISPLTLGARLSGHPEELLGGALCVAAVLAATDDRPIVSGILLGLAIGTKEWALIAIVPSLIACRRGRGEMLAVAAAVGAPLMGVLPLADPRAFSRASKLIGNLNVVYVGSWWWPMSDAHTVTVPVVGGYATATSHLLPLGLMRTQVFWLIPAVALPIGWLYRRTERERDRADALGLLALLLLLRCTLDPSCTFYYHLPLVFALLSWETLTRRGLPVASLVTLVVLWGVLGRLTANGPLVACNLALSIGLALYLGAGTMRRPRARWLSADLVPA